MERVNRSDPSGNERLRFPTLAPEKWRKDGARGFCGVLTRSGSCENEPLRILLEGL